jgi:hypothetical protein
MSRGRAAEPQATEAIVRGVLEGGTVKLGSELRSPPDLAI